MKKEWFEPGPDGVSPFVRKYKVSPGGVEDAIAAAFRALLAEEQAATPPALQVGDVVRLEPWDYSYSPEVLRATWTGEQARIIEAPEGHDWNRDGHIHVELLVHKGCSHATWPVSALTLIRRARDAQSVDTQRSIAAALANGQLSLQDEIVGLRAEVERLTARIAEMDPHGDRCVLLGEWNKAAAERDALQASLRDEQAKRASIEAELAACRQIRDALQARVDAGVPVCRFPSMKKSWSENLSSFPESCERGILLIDAQPLDHIVEPNKMVDERTGPADRRESSYPEGDYTAKRH